MKRGFILILTGLLILASAGFVASAQNDCSLSVSLLNQDPIHAVPGEYVKVVFQVEGVENPSCGTVNFALLPEYPFSLDPNVSTERTITSGTYTSSYNSQATIPFSLRVDPSALNKDYPIKVEYSTSSPSSAQLKQDFNISVQDITSDFEVFVQSYDSTKGTITFGIINIGKNNVEALTADVQSQDSLAVTGSTKSIVGSLDANQDSTFSFQGIPKSGNIAVTLAYNDLNGVRRVVQKSANFNSANFPTTATSSGLSIWFYLFVILVLVIVGRWAWKKFFGKKK